MDPDGSLRGQTHSISKYGIQNLLPSNLTLLHGPGCPVCVTPLELIDKALQIAAHPNVIFCSFGDMLRVPGSEKDLQTVKAEGGDVRTVYSPMESLDLARENPDKEVVFFAIGFETTAPANAMTIQQASKEKLNNLSFLVSQVTVPAAVQFILDSPENRVQGFLAAGHVCTIMGTEEYEPLTQKYKVPIVVTGFEPLDILQGILMAVTQLEAGQAKVENQYSRSVLVEGNPVAQRTMKEIFQVVPRMWRGIGEIPESGLGLRNEFAEFDAEKRFAFNPSAPRKETDCISGLVLQGIKVPSECRAFANRCTPETPMGAPMVSSEGVCAAYYRYRKVAV